MLKRCQLSSLRSTTNFSQEAVQNSNCSSLSEIAKEQGEEVTTQQFFSASTATPRLRLILTDVVADKTPTNVWDSTSSSDHESSCTCLICVDDSSSCAISAIVEEKKEFKRFRSFVSLASNDVSHDSEHVRQILEHNQQWVRETNERDPEYFTKLAQPQRPKYLYYGCSDSRVPANQILGLGPGEVFVHRNIGNQVMGNDLNALSVLEYGVMYIGVTDIIVTGHYDCGAVRAATKRQDLGTLEHWLRSIRDVYRLHRAELDDLEVC
ncbi:carbonic anhydrase [archaeon]|nr:MAG: carbonic anhydrase [archaeon]